MGHCKFLQALPELLRQEHVLGLREDVLVLKFLSVAWMYPIVFKTQIFRTSENQRNTKRIFCEFFAGNFIKNKNMILTCSIKPQRQFGFLFSTKACTPSCVTGKTMLHAIVCPANW